MPIYSNFLREFNERLREMRERFALKVPSFKIKKLEIHNMTDLIVQEYPSLWYLFIGLSPCLTMASESRQPRESFRQPGSGGLLRR
jgi:hypothetical protein